MTIRLSPLPLAVLLVEAGVVEVATSEVVDELLAVPVALLAEEEITEDDGEEEEDVESDVDVEPDELEADEDDDDDEKENEDAEDEIDDEEDEEAVPSSAFTSVWLVATMKQTARPQVIVTNIFFFCERRRVMDLFDYVNNLKNETKVCWMLFAMEAIVVKRFAETEVDVGVVVEGDEVEVDADAGEYEAGAIGFVLSFVLM